MTRKLWFTLELSWKVMMVLALGLGLSARAEPAMEPARLAQASVAERQQQAARHMLVTGTRSSMVIGEGGSIWVWGSGRGEELGTWPEYEIGSATPVRMPGMTGAVSIAMGFGTGHSLALMQDGTVQAWGSNFWGELGDGTTASRSTRVTALLTDVTAIAASYDHSLAVRRDGTVWAWGNNWMGELGDGTTKAHSTPTQVLRLEKIVSVAAGSGYSLALNADGTVWAWGENFVGQLGDGTQQQRLTPVQVPGLTNVVAIDARSSTSYALRADGTVWAWGANYSGELGDGSQDYARFTAGPVLGLSKVVSLAAGQSHALALRADGTVWAWGSNSFGQLANGTQGGTLPQKVQGLHDVVAVAAGEQHSMVLRQDGSLWTWGHNGNGQMGTGSDRQSTPARVVGLKDVQSVASSYFLTLAVRSDGTVWNWGSEQGLGGPVIASPERVQGLTKIKGVAAGDFHSLAVRKDGTVWAWGDNSRGQLGDGTVSFERRETPAPVQGLTGVVAVAAGQYHSLALKSDGTVWAWGANHYSQLGDMTLDDQPVPVQVQGLEGVAAIYASFDLSLAVKQDGTVWYWGSDWSVWDWGDRMPQPPAMVDGLSDVVSVSMMAPGILALRSDGTVWQWFLGSVWDQFPASPMEGLTDAVSVAWSSNTMQFLRTDGTVWNLGGNFYGERGIPTAGAYSSELQQVPGLTGVVSLSSESATIHALRADGTLMGWGSNMYGTVGAGISPLHLEPTRVQMPCKLKGLTSAEGIREQRQCHDED